MKKMTAKAALVKCRTILLLYAVFTICVLPTASLHASDKAQGPVILNGGENVRVIYKHTMKNTFAVVSGNAHRVPSHSAAGDTFTELDVDSRNFVIRTGMNPIVISGPSRVSVDGIEKTFGGSIENPSVFVEQDTNLFLAGKTRIVYIEFNPLARGTVDARRLVCDEVAIINNRDIEVLAGKGTRKSFYQAERPVETAVSAYNYGEESAPLPAASPPVPPAEAP